MTSRSPACRAVRGCAASAPRYTQRAVGAIGIRSRHRTNGAWQPSCPCGLHRPHCRCRAESAARPPLAHHPRRAARLCAHCAHPPRTVAGSPAARCAPPAPRHARRAPALCACAPRRACASASTARPRSATAGRPHHSRLCARVIYCCCRRCRRSLRRDARHRVRRCSRASAPLLEQQADRCGAAWPARRCAQGAAHLMAWRRPCCPPPAAGSWRPAARGCRRRRHSAARPTRPTPRRPLRTHA
eukprot:355136-Chlamydomonas_euryale.AAC.16